MICETEAFNCNVKNGRLIFPKDKINKPKYCNEDKLIMKPLDYHRKSFRYLDIPRRLAETFNYWIGAPEYEFENVHRGFEESLMGHFIIEDIFYNRTLREGKPTAHVVFGEACTINTHFYCGLSLPTLDGVDNTKLVDMMSHELLEILRSRNLQSQLSDGNICPDEKTCFRISSHKNNLMWLLPEIRFLQESYGKVPLLEFENLIEKIRIYYSIMDACKRVAKKNTEDIRWGNFSLPIVYAIESSFEHGQTILSIMQQKTADKDLLEFALLLIKKSKSLEKCKERLGQIREEILEEYAKFEKNPLFEDLLNSVLVVPDDFESVTLEIY